MKKKNILLGTLVISVLLIISTFSGTAVKLNTTNLSGTIDIVKKVYNGEGWVNTIDAEIGDELKFKIKVTYYNETAGTHYAENITIVDTLPPCLEYVADTCTQDEPAITDNILTWHLGDTILLDEETYIIMFNVTVVDCGENVNHATVDADEYCTQTHLFDEGTATVNVECAPPGIDVEKWIWDGYCEWVKEIHVYSGEGVRFRIVVTNTGGQNLTNINVTDILSDSLIYDNQATVNGEPWEPVITNGGKTLTWLFRFLEIGEEIIIEFNALTRGEPCDEDINYVHVEAESDCDPIEDEDEVTVYLNGMCIEKEVWNGETDGWADEATIGEGEEIQFKITVWYYGPYKLYNMKIWDQLPPCLDYADDATVDGVPYEPEVSEDGKTLWWNLSSDYVLYNGESLVIKFNAIAIENNCQPCINWAYIVTNECSGNILEGQDSATVYIICAFIADAGGPYYGEIGEDITITGDATGGSPPYSYAWDVDDAGGYDDATTDEFTWSWSEAGDYVIELEVTDDDGDKAYDYAYVSIAAAENQPPDIPSKPSGPSSGNPNKEYTYSTSTTDPNGDAVMYMFDWGDGATTGWLGPYTSGDTINAKHTYSAAGSYYIKVKAKDMPWFEGSDWSDELSVSITKDRAVFNNPLLMRIFNRLVELFPFLENLI